ncbi:acetate--CoA ligase family protein [Actinocrispum sp. NPDC049592]|uniref:acetate--CoA ligase family protein n=1 Tax=Actinocrispum sp. NPDC049592 TaxID=3154835 RepID=UPI00342B3E80
MKRLLSPRHIAVVGGAHAKEVIRQSRALGYRGEIWLVHPRLGFPDVDSLPEPPDASFIAVNRESTVDVVGQLAARGAGGAVCYASGFAETGAKALQQRLVDAAGGMPLIGPNCYGLLNYLDGAALWPDQQGGRRVERGVAIITQSGNIAVNLTMQRRSLPIGCVIAVGNMAGVTVPELITELVTDPRITAIGLHIEGLDDIEAFARAAIVSKTRGTPLVVLKSGTSEQGARITVSHTSSLAGPDIAYDALFRRLGIARVRDVPRFVETLKFLHVHGPLPGKRVTSASCSGGEAALVADLAQDRGLDLAPLSNTVREALTVVLGDKVAISNPLDYHTYIWGDRTAQTQCFAALRETDVQLLMLDFPRDDRCQSDEWGTTLDAFIDAKPTRGCVVSLLPENLPESLGERLIAHGIAPMQGLPECLDAIAASVDREARPIAPVIPVGSAQLLDEWQSKEALAGHGVPVPDGRRTRDPVQAAEELGCPVVVKALGVAHKSELNAVRLGLENAKAVVVAVQDMPYEEFLVERMVPGAVAELIVGVRHDPQFGHLLTIGAGGVLVELLRDTATLLFPVDRDEVREALTSLKIWPLLTGFRGREPGDVDAVLEAVLAIAAYAQADAVAELDVNPLVVCPKGVVAVDALIRR